MSTVGAIAQIISTGLSMLDKYVDDPVRRLKARQDYIDSLKKVADDILLESDPDKLDAYLLEFIAAVHQL